MSERRASPTSSWRWREASVDEGGDYLLLSYAPRDLPVAIVGPPVDDVFPVRFLTEASNPDSDVAVPRDAARKELDFYLVELGEPDPWNYVIYHCGQGANLYSSIHWSWHPAEARETGSE
jgi:hypothetical protein